MKILLSNDDGVYAPGIIALYKELSKIAKVVVVAPDRDQSASGKSLTLRNPLRPRVHDNGFISIDGTPTDCVHYGLTTLDEHKFDMVVSGINAGDNLGDDVLYSGTVSAATEGRFLGTTAIATSLAGLGDNYDGAAEIVRNIVQHVIENPFTTETVLNVNIPDIPKSEIKGIKVCRLGKRHAANGMIETTDPRGSKVYWIGPVSDEKDGGEGTDFHAVKNRYVAITPLEVDLTCYKLMDMVDSWTKGLEF